MPTNLPDSVINGVIIAGLALVVVALVMRLTRRGKPTGPSITPVEQLERTRQTKGTQADLEALMTELEQLARRLGSQLDAKSARLEKLLAEADRRMEAMGQMNGTLPRRATAPPAPPEAVAGNLPGGQGDSVAMLIYKLADAGHNSTEIARQLNEHIGKVELILALRQSA